MSPQFDVFPKTLVAIRERRTAITQIKPELSILLKKRKKKEEEEEEEEEECDNKFLTTECELLIGLFFRPYRLYIYNFLELQNF